MAVNPNIVAAISGEPKTGKSHLGLTFPDPMVVFSFDIGLEPVRAKFPEKKIEVKTYPMPFIDSVKGTGFQKELKEIWDTFNKDYKATVEDTDVATIMVDTWTAVYEVARIARAKELGQENLLQFQYGDVYARMRSLIQRPRMAGQNLILTTYMRDKYVKDQSTGEKEADGWKGTMSEADIILWTRRTTKPAPGGKKKTTIITTIKDNRYELDLNELEFENLTYKDLMDLLVG